MIIPSLTTLFSHCLSYIGYQQNQIRLSHITIDHLHARMLAHLQGKQHEASEVNPEKSMRQLHELNNEHMHDMETTQDEKLHIDEAKKEGGSPNEEVTAEGKAIENGLIRTTAVFIALAKGT